MNMFSQKLNKNKKINSIKKAITTLIILSMLLSMVQTRAFAADEPLKIQVGNTTSWEEAITEANIKGSATIEITNDITLTNNIAITSDITIISTKGDHTITTSPSIPITIQGGTLTIGDSLATNHLTISSTNIAIQVESGTVHIKDGSTITTTGDNSKAIFVDNGEILVSGGTITATGEDCKAIYVNNGEILVSGGTITATGDYCSAIEVITGNVAVSGGTITASMNVGHDCYAICLGNIFDPTSGGTVTITGGTISATSTFGDSFAISLQKAGLAAYLKDTCEGDFEAWGTSIIVEVESLDISSSYGGTNNGLTRKAGSAISNVKWVASGDILAISFNNKQYTIEWATYSVCEIIDTDGVTKVAAYGNFADALAAVQDGQTIRLLDNIEYNAGIKITNKSVTFDVNGFSLNVINSAGHGLEVGAGGEVWLTGAKTSGAFNVKGGSLKQGLYVHSGGKAEVTTTTTTGGGNSVLVTGSGSEITIYGDIKGGGFYGLEASAGATVTVYGNVIGGGGMLVSGEGTTVTVYGYSSGGGTGVYAYNGASIFVGGNVIGGGAGVHASTGAQVTVNGTVKATSGNKVYAQVNGVDKMQEDHELTSSKDGYFEYKNGDSIVWVKDPVVYVVRHRETGNLYKTISEAIAAINPTSKTFVLEVLGDVTEKEHIIINDETVTIVSVEGNHIVTFANPAQSSGLKITLQGGGKLTLGEGTSTNVLTILGSISVTNGEIKIQEGTKIISNDYAVLLSGPNANGAINGGHLEGTTGALSLKKGAKISEISGGAFYGKQEAAHLTDINTRIEKISGGSFYQTDPEIKLHGQAIFVQNEAQIGEISGGYFEAARSNALIIIRGSRVDEISGGKFVGRNTYDTDGNRNAVVMINSDWTYPVKASIGTVSGGHFIGGHFGMLSITGSSIGSEIDKITGGTFEATVAFQNDRYGVVNEISGGTFKGIQGMLNAGKIGKISGNVEIIGTTSYGIFNYAGGQIDEIAGGRIISNANDGIANAGTIKLISGGTIIGKWSAINCDGLNKGKLEVISNGVFQGEYDVAIILSSNVVLEPGLSGKQGLGRYWGKDGKIFNNEALVTYPMGYYMSARTTSVEGINDVRFRYLTLDDKYTIEYVLNGGINNPDNPAAYDETDLPCNIVDPTKVGYDFQGWTVKYLDGNQADITTPTLNYNIPVGTTGDIILTANWKPIQYKIIYNLNGGDNAPNNPTTYNINNLPIKIVDPTRLGYEFWGWEVQYANGTAEPGLVFNYEIPEGTTGDITLTANGPPIVYTITYNLNGGEHTKTPSIYSVMSTFPINIANPTKTGYEFLGWTVTYENGISTTNKISFQILEGTTGNIELTANWSKAISYNIIYNLNGGEHTKTPNTYTVEDLPLSIADPTKLGYEFEGWEITYADNSMAHSVTSYTIPKGTTGDILLEARFGHHIWFDITYNLNGGEHTKTPNTYCEHSSFPINIANPTKTGYEFLGWTVTYENGISTTNKISFQILEGTTGNIELTANWSKAISYNIIYNLNEGEHSKTPSSYTVEDLPVAIANPTRLGYEFWGWKVQYANGTAEPDLVVDYVIPEGTTGDIILTAKGHTGLYNIIYNLDGGEHSKTPSSYTILSTFPINIANPTKTNYDFLGWTVKYLDGNKADITIPTLNYNIPAGTTGDIILTANWKSSSTGGGTQEGGGSGGGTNNNNNSGSGGGSSTGNNGIWYTVRFVDWDGVLLKSERVRSGGDATAPNAPARVSYIFIGWDRGFTNVRSDITVTAQYTPEETNITPLTIVAIPWALANLVLSVVGIILAIIVTIWVLLQQKKQQKNNKFQNTTMQSSEQEKKQKPRKLWLITALALGITGIITFLLTENINHKMTIIDKWTIINAIIFIAEIITITLIFKHKKDTQKEKTKKP